MELRRLVESSPHALTRDLLDSGVEDAPPPRSASRVAAALGLAAGVTGAGMPALAVASGASGTLLGGSSHVGAVAILKWLGAGLLAGTVVSGGAAIARRGVSSSERPTPTLTETPPRGTPAPRAGGEFAAPRTDAPARPLPLDAPPAGRSAPSTSRVGPASTGPAVATLPDEGSALAYEVARIDQARVSLRAGNAKEALAALTRYDEERRTRVLDREAAVLRIEALRLAGLGTEAREQAQRYLDRFPADAHTAGLREFVHGADITRGIDP
jgi:hypothetical protein